MSKIKDMTGQRFGRLTVIRLADEQVPGGSARWVCRCECGTEKTITRGQLIRGETNSCGCLRKEKLTKKYPRKGRLYQIWLDMKQRCYNPNIAYYNIYGGRGITVCHEWREDYCPFYEWAMANGYDNNKTIDRINPNGNYSPKNCRWATAAEQTNNRRTTRYVEIDGKLVPRSEAAKRLGITYRRLRFLDESGKLSDFIKSQKGVELCAG